MSERNDELTRLSYTLGENMEDRFYVYMLQDDNGKPFYIGKGQGGRVFCHENDADKLLEVIRSENGDRNVDYSKLSEKIKLSLKVAARLKGHNKWGLTENEAFMCESALMNMYDYIFLKRSPIFLMVMQAMLKSTLTHLTDIKRKREMCRIFLIMLP